VSNADTLRRVFALMDERDYPSIRELLALEFSAVMGGNPPMGFEEWEGMGRMIYAGCPDGKHAFDETFEIGDRVASRGSFSGTHTGDLMGIPPSIAARPTCSGSCSNSARSHLRSRERRHCRVTVSRGRRRGTSAGVR
jgi:predicted ester cyclase